MSQQRVCAYCGRVTWETNLHLCDPGTAQFKLTERLAERERDEWKAKAEESKGEFAPCEKHGAYGCSPCRTIATLTAERDAALADLKIARHSLGEALAKAEAAESKRDYWHGQWFGLSQEASQFVDLRARIEALADRFERADVKAPPWLALRALLTPPKEETALDVLSRIEKWGDTDEPMDAITEDMAKLRKLLEAGEGK